VWGLVVGARAEENERVITMSCYTKKHFIETAKAIHDSGARGKVLARLTEHFAGVFANANPQFNPRRFAKACSDGTIRQRPNASPRPFDRYEPPSRLRRAFEHALTCPDCKTIARAERHLADDELTHQARLALEAAEEKAA
jgi:hypothetical protein